MDTEGGFLLILSGTSVGEPRATAGVGFLVSPRARHCIVRVCQETSRMASLKFRAPGGKCSVCCICAPHMGRPRDERQDFYQKLAQWLLSRSQHGPLMVIGDFNARLHGRLDSDPESIGIHIFGDGPRSLLLELCECCRLSIADTFFNEPPQRQVTCYSMGAGPSSELTPENFGQIDHDPSTRIFTWRVMGTWYIRLIWGQLTAKLDSRNDKGFLQGLHISTFLSIHSWVFLSP